MLCLADTSAVEEVVFGAGGVASWGEAGAVVVDFSSIDPLATTQFADRLQRARGMHWIDAPVSGGTVGAEAGRLVVMAGGERGQLERIRPLLAPLSRRVTHMGRVGSGQITKVCNQMLVATNALVIAEVIALARRAGVDVGRIAGALEGGFADSLPLQILAPQMAAHDYTLKWKVATLLKDLDLAVAQSKRCRLDLPVVRLARDLVREHAGAGNAVRDLSTLVERYEPAELT
jgi:3-hydroxyisobutyrate dehydrogenase